MAAILPRIPRLIFTILEPMSLAAGFYGAVLDTSNFVSAPVASSISASGPYIVTPESRILALQLGNMFSLVGLIGIGVLYSTVEPKVVRNYLLACAIGDVGHVYFTYVCMGYAAIVDVKAWDALTWGNIGFTLFLLLSRLLYLSGYLGQDRLPLACENAKVGVKGRID